MSLEEQLVRVILRTLSARQLLLLRECRQQTLSSFANRFSREQDVPLSTVKRDLRKLRELGCFSFEQGKDLRLTEAGLLLKQTWGDEHG